MQCSVSQPSLPPSSLPPRSKHLWLYRISHAAPPLFVAPPFYFPNTVPPVTSTSKLFLTVKMFGFREDTSPLYEQLPTGETKTLAPQHHRNPPWTQRVFYLLVVLWNIVLLTGAVYGLKSYLTTRHLGPVIKPISCDCGASIAEPKSLGRKYDTLSVSWLPPQCRDDALAEEFNHAGPDGEWHYWADRTGRSTSLCPKSRRWQIKQYRKPSSGPPLGGTWLTARSTGGRSIE